MIQLHENSIYLVDGRPEEKASIPQNEARKQTMAWQILQAHNTSGDPERLKIRFDAMVSHDITYVGIIQQARASGMKEFPIPYALTNCHNSLCAVGGTINEDDHVFGLSAAKKYGGIYDDTDESIIDSKRILPADKMADICSRLKVHIGIICVPPECAQSVCDKMVASGILAIWNFAPVHLSVPTGVIVQYENLAASLAVLSQNLEFEIRDGHIF